MVKTILIGQIHEDPAAFMAAYHIIKKCVDNGVKVVCGVEDDRSLADIIKSVESDVWLRTIYLDDASTDVKNSTPPIMPRNQGRNGRNSYQAVMGNTSGRPEQLALLRYLAKNNISVVPLEDSIASKNFSTKRQELALQLESQGLKGEEIQQEYAKQHLALNNEYEISRVQHMVGKLSKIHTTLLSGGHDNAVVVLFNMGYLHQERIARHAKVANIDVNIIECLPPLEKCYESLQGHLRNGVATKAKREQLLDTEEIQQIPVSVTHLTLDYNTSNTISRLGETRRIADIQPGEFPDFLKVEPHIHDLTPSIHINTEDGIITLPTHQFDLTARINAGFNKSRLSGIDEQKKATIEALSENITLIADNNKATGTYLTFYPTKFKNQIDTIIAPKTKISTANPILESILEVQGKATSSKNTTKGI